MVEVKVTEQQAYEGFFKGVDCSQAVFGELAPQLGMDRETAMKVSANFGGGMWQGETCGCVVGALMALGLKYGQADSVDPEKKAVMQETAARFCALFSERFGSCICREMLGYKIPEEMPKIMEENKFGTVCCKAAVAACEIAAEILNEG